MANDLSDIPVSYGGTKHYNEEEGASYDDNPDYWTEYPEYEYPSPPISDDEAAAIGAVATAVGGPWGGAVAALCIYLYNKYLAEKDSHS
jgi:hypothetical protein